ncbi:MAG: zinc ABC transporter substrate-binding protein [Candidatus Thiodiazotropha sp.]
MCQPLRSLLFLTFFYLPATQAMAALQVFACEPEWAALTREMGGEGVDVFSATHAGQDPHHIQARPSLIARMRSADLVVCSGAGLESGWLPMLQRRARNPRVMSGESGLFEASRQVTLLDKPESLDRSEGDIHGDGNPHIQLDPRRLLQVAGALSLRLQQLDPADAGYYQARLDQFQQRWTRAMQVWQEAAQPLRGVRVIVFHREWVYLLDWLGMTRVGSLEPKPGVPPGIDHLASLKKLPADLVILSPLNDPKPAQWLQEQTGITLVTLPQTVTATEDSGDLFKLFDSLVQRLTSGLQR